MNLPTLPTDNLYKFMAISGLVLYVMVNMFLLQNSFDLFKQSIQIEGEQQVLEAEITAVKEVSQKEEWKNTIDAPRAYIEQKKAIAKLKAKLMELRLLNERMARYNFYALVVGIFACILMAYGFTAWYFKIQKYQDIKIKNENA